MNLWLSGLFLVAGLFLGSSALTAEECKPLVTPHATFKPMYGRWTFIMGYSDNPVYDAMFRSTKSQWIDFIRSPSGNENVMIEDIGIKHPTYCKYASTPVTIFGNSGISWKSNFTCTFHSLPTCSNCLLYHTTSINNNNLMLPEGTPTVKEELKGYKAFYLMSTKVNVKPEDLAHAKKQAECLGFKGEPTFLFNPDDGFCEQGIDP